MPSFGIFLHGTLIGMSHILPTKPLSHLYPTNLRGSPVVAVDGVVSSVLHPAGHLVVSQHGSAGQHDNLATCTSFTLHHTGDAIPLWCRPSQHRLVGGGDGVATANGEDGGGGGGGGQGVWLVGSESATERRRGAGRVVDGYGRRGGRVAARGAGGSERESG